MAGGVGVRLWIGFFFTFVLPGIALHNDIGVNWGSMLTHPMLPIDVVEMLKDNGITKVKLFDADDWTVTALGGSGIEVMVAIPNDQLQRMNNYGNAKDWVEENVTRYDVENGVSIKYIAVGNEPFLATYNNSFDKITFPALKNIQKALDESGAGTRIKATIPLNADVYGSPEDNPVPSAGDFKPGYRKLMQDIVKFLHQNGAPFLVNIYPFLSLYQGEDFPLDYAFFEGRSAPVVDGNIQYTNVFDANFDTLVWSLKKAGVPDIKIVVGEVGWPTDGDQYANSKLAKRFYDGFLKKIAKKEGTPLRPGKIEVYLFGLIDEDLKSIAPGNFERHWGIFTYDGKPKFPMDLTGKDNDKLLVPVKNVTYLPEQWCTLNEHGDKTADLSGNVNYACSAGDCTALGYGSSCNGLDERGNISYAFNMYFQMQDQDVRACDFQGLAVITTKNASRNGCLFPVQIFSAGEWSSVVSLPVVGLAVMAVMMVLL